MRVCTTQIRTGRAWTHAVGGGGVRAVRSAAAETILFARKPINRAQENGNGPGFNSVRCYRSPPLHIDNASRQPTRSQIIYHLHSVQLESRCARPSAIRVVGEGKAELGNLTMCNIYTCTRTHAR